MRIGIDFDNTIAQYDKIFVKAAIDQGFISKDWFGNKAALKKKLNKKEIQWQILQGQVYGPLMTKAICFSGVQKFFCKANLIKYEIFIISHKTIYGHYDKTNTKLRDQALLWLEKKKFFKKKYIGLKKENIFFCDSLDKKIEKINELNLDFMIDDLNKIFEKSILKKTKTILFNSPCNKTKADYRCQTWDQISNVIFTKKQNEYSLIQICNLMHPGYKFNSINKINQGKNSSVYKLQNKKNNFLILKEYPNDNLAIKYRLKKELKALKFLDYSNNVPKVINHNYSMDIIMLEYIEGKSVSKISNKNIEDALIFVKQLYKLSQNTKFNLATEACLSANELIRQIDCRFDVLKIVVNEDLQDLISKLYELYKKLKVKSLENWPKKNIYNKLEKNYLVLSPSDFGFHNSILDNNNILKFIDFEYFGFDDPVKLVSDFLWHPGMKLSKLQKKKFAMNSFKLFKDDKNFYKRFCLAFPLYGIRWSLIILNDFLKNRDNISKIEEKKVKKSLELQLKKSKNIYDTLLNNDINNIYER
jgi:aminoglycoside phosphotransferase